jgi:predicted nucleic acid-binding protein
MLVDTSILLRTLQLQHPQLSTVRNAIKTPTAQPRDLHIAPQNLVELWAVATRPLEQNGLGMTPPAAAGELTQLKSMFLLLPKTSAIYPVWESLVTQHQVSGKSAHDARLVAAMKVRGLTAILTFERAGFSRFPGIQVVNPADVAAGSIA